MNTDPIHLTHSSDTRPATHQAVLQENEQLRRDRERLTAVIEHQQAELTRLKQQEETLQSNANRLANLIADFQEGILLEDQHRAIVLVNQHFCDLFNVPAPPEVLKGMDCSGMAEQSKDYFERPVEFVERVNQLLADRKHVVGEELVLADGRVFERDYIPIFTDNVYAGHLWKYADITKRKQAEAAAFRLKEKYQRIIDNMNLGLIEVDLDERIVYTNQSFCAMSGYEADELIGNIATDILLKGQNAEVMKEKNDSRVGGAMDAYEIAIKNKRGEAMWWLISGAPLYSETGEVIGSTGIHLDITQQKQLESELRVAKQEAERSAKTKELFLANMSHEIRTPMNAILSLGQQLTKTPLTEQQEFFLTMINTAASNLLVIINDILDFSKIEAGQLTLEQIGFDMADLLQRTVDVMSHKADEKRLSLCVKTDSGKAPVLIGDPYRLNQILLNLIGNAIKFTNEGSVQVHYNHYRRQNKQVVTLAVADTGIGIDPEFQQNLFTKFTQEDVSTGRKYGGTGLGMSITKQLVDLMGGSITVDSVKGKGTTVHVQLIFPIGTPDDLLSQHKQEPNDAALTAKRILLVEDNDMNRLVVTTLLTPYGIDVTEVTNGLDALTILRNTSFDLILMDVQMPVMDGLEATRIIREQISQSVPIIALTASAIRSEEEACYSAGMNDFMAKPFEERALVDTLTKWLDGRLSTPVEEPDVPTTGALYDLSKLETISRGNQAFTLKMVGLFCADAPAVASQLSEAYELSDFQKIKYLAHRIKPSIDNMGIQSQTEAIRQIEHLAGTAPESAELLTLITNFGKAIDEITAHMMNAYKLTPAG